MCSLFRFLLTYTGWTSEICGSKIFSPRMATMTQFFILLSPMSVCWLIRNLFFCVGLKILLSFTINHSSDEHPWFQKSIKKEGNYTDYYIWASGKGSDADGNRRPPNNWVRMQPNALNLLCLYTVRFNPITNKL